MIEGNKKNSYRSPFKRLDVTDLGMIKISQTQTKFDGLYRELHRELKLDKSPHLHMAREHLENACFRYCRAIAEQYENKD